MLHGRWGAPRQHSRLCFSATWDQAKQNNPALRFCRGLLSATSGGGGSGPPPFTFTWREALMLAITFVVSALSMPAGIGGGIIFVPLLNALLQFSERAAVRAAARAAVGALPD